MAEPGTTPDPYERPAPIVPYQPPAQHQPYGVQPYGTPPYGMTGYPPAGPYGAPFGLEPGTGVPYSDKSKAAAGLLQLLLPFVGIPGVGRLYAGHIAIGLIQLLGAIVSFPLMCLFVGFLTLPGFLLWSMIDGIVLLASRSVDGNNRPLR